MKGFELTKKALFLSLGIYLALLIFTRFYNLDRTATFSEDESGFLVRAHQIFQERKITLVGQVNELGTKVFSSLSIYLLLPAAILGKFDLVSTFYGAAFWGVATGLLMLYLGSLINKKMLISTAILTLFWFPLLQTGRWAWNPNFIPLWISLGIIFYLQKKPLSWALAGLCFGLSVHQHYYAIFATALFTLLATFEAIKEKKYRNAALINLGLIVALLPFIIFDLRHPPGIFFLGASKQVDNLRNSPFLSNLLDYTVKILQYHARSTLLAISLVLAIILLLRQDIKGKSRAIFFFLPCLFQIIMVAAAAPYFFHYFFPLIPFFFVWAIFPRQKTGKLLSFAVIFILIVGGISALIPQLTVSAHEPNVSTIRKINSVLKREIQSNNLRRVNLAVLASPDRNTQGRKYRDLLLIPDNIHIMPKEEYTTSDNLFVVSTAQEQVVREDVAFEMDNFRFGVITGRWKIIGTPWVIYLFNKNAK